MTGKQLGLAAIVAALAAAAPQASSHREAPGITKAPKTDGTDFYMFRSYEPGKADTVTLIANYIPLQDVYGGPNFFTLDSDALYEMHIDNNGDAREDLSFQFTFENTYKDISLNVGGKVMAIPLVNAGRVGPGVGDNGALNVIESYRLRLVRGKRGQVVRNASTGGATFIKPVDRIGDKSISDPRNILGSVEPNGNYDTYANNHIYPISIPGCAAPGRVFVGQRREGFVVNLAETFDLINDNPVGPRDGETNDLSDKNVTTLALELPIACVTRPNNPVIGAWTTSSVLRRATKKPDFDVENDDEEWGGRGRYVQVSRLGHPLVNEVVIGLKDKDRFNSSEPRHDGQFADYVTNPTFPALIEALFGFAGVQAPVTPRADLVAVFLTGVPGLNQPANVVPSEMLRLNTAIDPRASGAQDSLGVLGGDVAGFPNGRRPGDDVVDIALRAVMGVLLPADKAPTGQLPYTDGALVNATVAYDPDGRITADPKLRLFRDAFPYLEAPLSGSPNPTHAN